MGELTACVLCATKSVGGFEAEICASLILVAARLQWEQEVSRRHSRQPAGAELEKVGKCLQCRCDYRVCLDGNIPLGAPNKE